MEFVVRPLGLVAAFLLLGLLFVGSASPEAAEGSEGAYLLLPGDIDCDDATTSIDGLIILQFVAGVTPLPECKSVADLSGNGGLDAIDAALVLQVDAGLVSPVGRDGNLARGKTPGCVLLIINDGWSIQVIGAVPEPAPPGYFLRVRGFSATPDKDCADEALRIFSSTYLTYI